jgi:hypothetical protein
MATIRTQDLSFDPSQAGSVHDGATMGRHALFGTLSLVVPTTTGATSYTVGGMQAYSMEENNNTVFRNQAGNDWLEPVYGMREWSGQGSRFQIRGQDLMNIFSNYGVIGVQNNKAVLANFQDLDFRFMPFVWHYQFLYEDPSGSLTYENTNWAWAQVWITRYRWTFTSPTELLSEDFSFIARGYQRFGKDTNSVIWGVNSQLIGQPSADVATPLG